MYMFSFPFTSSLMSSPTSRVCSSIVQLFLISQFLLYYAKPLLCSCRLRGGIAILEQNVLLHIIIANTRLVQDSSVSKMVEWIATRMFEFKSSSLHLLTRKYSSEKYESLTLSLFTCALNSQTDWIKLPKLSTSLTQKETAAFCGNVFCRVRHELRDVIVIVFITHGI